MEDKKTKIITIRYDDETYREIEKYAKQEHRKLSDFVRHTTQVYIERIKEVETMRK